MRIKKRAYLQKVSKGTLPACWGSYAIPKVIVGYFVT